jgi:hypothetical protein
MRTTKFILIIALLALLNSCETNDPLTPLIGKVNLSECKSNLKSISGTETADTLSCIYYSYDSREKLLMINHINAGFNCCPGEICCTATLSGDTLIVTETESTSLCDCDCLFDLNIEIDNVDNTAHHLRIIEPYWSGAGSLEFDIFLKNSTEDNWCSTRKRYPWGL